MVTRQASSADARARRIWASRRGGKAEDQTQVGSYFVANYPPFSAWTKEGVQPEILAQVFKTSGARLFYSQSTHANPTGATLAPLRRQGALDVVARAGAILIEDDWCRELSFAKMPLPPLASGDRNGHCVYLRSLTKAGEAGELDG